MANGPSKMTAGERVKQIRETQSLGKPARPKMEKFRDFVEKAESLVVDTASRIRRR